MAAVAATRSGHEPRAGHGLTRTELTILERYDRGLSAETIAHELEWQIDSVKRVISRLQVDMSQDRATRAAAADGSQRLLRAQIQSGQHFLSPPMADLVHKSMGLRTKLARSA